MAEATNLGIHSGSQVPVQVAENTTSSSRSGQVVIVDEAVKTHKLIAKFTQSPEANIELAVVSATPSFEGSTERIPVLNAGTWAAATTADWITVPSGNQTAAFLAITYKPNNTSSNRSGVVTVTRSDGASVRLTVNQVASTAEVPYLRPTTLMPSYESGSATFVVTATGSWTVMTAADWLTIPTGNQTGASLSVSWTENLTGSPRTGTISLMNSGRTRTLTITQAAAPRPAAPRTITLSPHAQTRLIPVTALAPYTMTGQFAIDPQRPHISQWIQYPAGNQTGTSVSITVLNNPNANLRSARYQIIQADGQRTNPVQYRIRQLGTSAANAVVPEFGFLDVPSRKATYTFEIGGPEGWTVHADSNNTSWLRAEKISETALLVKITQENTTGTSRQKTILLDSERDNIADRGLILILQQPGAAESDLPALSAEVLRVAGTASQVRVRIPVTKSWRVTSEASWLSYSAVTRPAPAEGAISTVDISIPLNNTGIQRQAVVVIQEGTTPVDTFSIIQDALPPPSFEFKELYVLPHSQRITLNVKAGETWSLQTLEPVDWITKPDGMGDHVPIEMGMNTGGSIELTFNANTNEGRSTVIRLTQADSQTVDLIVAQFPVDLVITKTTGIVLNPAGDAVALALNVRDDATWEVTKRDAATIKWLKVPIGEQTSNTLVLSAAPLDDIADRSAVIEIDEQGGRTQQINVLQESLRKFTPLPPAPRIAVPPLIQPTSVIAYKEQTTLSLRVRASYKFRISPTASDLVSRANPRGWVEMSKTAYDSPGKKADDGIDIPLPGMVAVPVVLRENLSEMSRNTTIIAEELDDMDMVIARAEIQILQLPIEERPARQVILLARNDFLLDYRKQTLQIPMYYTLDKWFLEMPAIDWVTVSSRLPVHRASLDTSSVADFMYCTLIGLTRNAETEKKTSKFILHSMHELECVLRKGPDNIGDESCYTYLERMLIADVAAVFWLQSISTYPFSVDSNDAASNAGGGSDIEEVDVDGVRVEFNVNQNSSLRSGGIEVGGAYSNLRCRILRLSGQLGFSFDVCPTLDRIRRSQGVSDLSVYVPPLPASSFYSNVNYRASSSS